MLWASLPIIDLSLVSPSSTVCRHERPLQNHIEVSCSLCACVAPLRALATLFEAGFCSAALPLRSKPSLGENAQCACQSVSFRVTNLCHGHDGPVSLVFRVRDVRKVRLKRSSVSFGVPGGSAQDTTTSCFELAQQLHEVAVPTRGYVFGRGDGDPEPSMCCMRISPDKSPIVDELN